ncbi:MAG: pyrroline-5-carboxylate reductase [Candidatus Geothermarchaeales archaeon]
MKVAIIGAGTIGGAIARCLVESGRYETVMATRRKTGKLTDLEKLSVVVDLDNRRAAEAADFVVVAVKPSNVFEVVSEIRDKIRDKIVLSLAAAISLKVLERAAPEAKFIRAMPNIAVLVQSSFTAYSSGSDVTSEDRRRVEEVLQTMGEFAEVEEKHMDAITGLSGSLPAYLFTIVEALMYAGIKVGLPRDFSLKSAAQTVLGSAKLILETQKHFAELKDMVVTPGGVTIEGIYELEDKRIRTAIMRAVEAATYKSKKIAEFLGKES